MGMNPGMDEISPFIKKWLCPQRGSLESRSRDFWHSLIEIFDCRQAEAKRIWKEARICQTHCDAVALVFPHLHFLVWQIDRGGNLSYFFKAPGMLSSPLRKARSYNASLSRVWRASTIVLCNFEEFFLFDLNHRDSAMGRPTVKFSLKDLFEYRMYIFLLLSGKIFSQRYRNLDGVQVESAPHPISPSLPEMRRGNTALSGGKFYFGEKEVKEALKDSMARKYVRKFVRAVDLRAGGSKYCLWLLNSTNRERKSSPYIRKKLFEVEAYRKLKLHFKHEIKPWNFAEVRQPECSYLAIPTKFSLNREYVPCGFFAKDVIASDTLDICPDPDCFAFGLASSAMFKAWQSVAAEVDESGTVHFSIPQVWNTFPLPEVSQEEKEGVEKCGREVLRIRERYSDIPLSDLYAPGSLPEDLKLAHADLDKAVDAIFGEKCRDNEERRKVVTIAYKETPSGSDTTFLKRAASFAGQIGLLPK